MQTISYTRIRGLRLIVTGSLYLHCIDAGEYRIDYGYGVCREKTLTRSEEFMERVAYISSSWWEEPVDAGFCGGQCRVKNEVIICGYWVAKYFNNV